MGGLDGYPVTGLTGMGASASHVPDDGAVFIFYGPHIGVSKAGVVGEIHRYGQSTHSSCCGAAKGVLAKLMSGSNVAGHVTDLDYQMNTIEQILLREKDRMVNAKPPLQKATEVIYEAIDRKIEELVSLTQYNCKYVILMGAVLINGDSDAGSFTSTKKFVALDLKKCTRED